MSSGIGVALDRAAPAVAETDELVAVDLHALADDGPDHCVQSRAVATTGQHTDPHGHHGSDPDGCLQNRRKGADEYPVGPVRSIRAAGALAALLSALTVLSGAGAGTAAAGPAAPGTGLQAPAHPTVADLSQLSTALADASHQAQQAAADAAARHRRAGESVRCP